MLSATWRLAYHLHPPSIIHHPPSAYPRHAAAKFWPSEGAFRASGYDLGEVEREMEAQVERALASGLKISYVDAHHNIARFTWELSPVGGGECPVIGFDVLVAAQDGRLRGVYGFLDKVPASVS